MSLLKDLNRLPKETWKNDKVVFRPLQSEKDLIYVSYECQLTEEQKDLVNPAWFEIGRAFLNKEDNYPCVIMNENNELIGFINLRKWLGDGDAYSWSFFIDKRHQGKGYGKKSTELAVIILKAANSNKKIKLATEVGNTKAQKLYVSVGFYKTTEKDGEDLVFEI